MAHYVRAHVRGRDCYLTPVDQDSLYAMLCERYPTTICGVLDSENRQFIRYKSITESTRRCYILIPEKADWEVEWEIETSGSGYQRPVVANFPKRCLLYDQAEIKTFKVSHYVDRDLPNRALNDDIMRFIGHMQIQGNYYDDEPEEKAFLTWFFNAIRHRWTNRYQVVDLMTDKVIDEYSGSYDWCGPDTVRRCMEEPNFFTVVWDDPRYETLIGIKALPKKPRARKRSGAGEAAEKG